MRGNTARLFRDVSESRKHSLCRLKRPLVHLIPESTRGNSKQAARQTHETLLTDLFEATLKAKAFAMLEENSVFKLADTHQRAGVSLGKGKPGFPEKTNSNKRASSLWMAASWRGSDKRCVKQQQRRLAKGEQHAANHEKGGDKHGTARQRINAVFFQQSESKQ